VSATKVRRKISDEDARLLARWIRSHLYEERYREGYGYSYHARHSVTNEQISESYQSWAKGGSGWNQSQQGGTGIMATLVWYQHVHKPGSREWRPSIILRAAVREARTALDPAPKEESR
jgi:hypothetical protein